MQQIKSHRHLRNGVLLRVTNSDGQLLLTGSVVGFPYRSSERDQSDKQAEPDVIVVKPVGQVRVPSIEAAAGRGLVLGRVFRLSMLGIGSDGVAGHQAFAINRSY